MSDPLHLARYIAERREINAAAERWIVNAFAAWWRGGADPARLAWAFRFPTGARWATTRRDDYLRAVAADLFEPNRGAALKVLIDHFMKETWPAWRDFQEPPDDAESGEQLLFYAARTGAPMRLSRRRINGILAGK